MTNYLANYSKLESKKRGQLKIQQMAFVLVAFMVLFGIAGVFYISIKSSSLKESADELRHERASEIVRKLASSAELNWRGDDCSICVDEDKALALKNIESYKEFWGEDVIFVRIDRVYPGCGSVYEERRCDSIEIYDSNIRKDYISEEAFVALCRYEGLEEGKRCEIGRIVMGVRENV